MVFTGPCGSLAAVQLYKDNVEFGEAAAASGSQAAFSLTINHNDSYTLSAKGLDDTSTIITDDVGVEIVASRPLWLISITLW